MDDGHIARERFLPINFPTPRRYRVDTRLMTPHMHRVLRRFMLLLLAALIPITDSVLMSRGQVLLRLVAGPTATILTSQRAAASTRETLFGTGSAERCENGEGEACSRLADGNDYIMKLQARSRANKEKNARELYEKTVRQLGYSDFMDQLNLNLVLLSNGSYAVLTPEVYAEKRKAGKIKPGSVDELLD